MNRTAMSDGGENVKKDWEHVLRKRVAYGLLYVSRLLVVALSVSWMGYVLARSAWRFGVAVPTEQIDSWSNAAFGTLIAVAVVWPFIICPVGSPVLIEVVGSTLVVRTVLGRRVLDRNSIHGSLFKVPGGWSHDWIAVMLHDDRGKVTVLVHSELWSSQSLTTESKDLWKTIESMRQIGSWAGCLFLCAWVLGGIAALVIADWIMRTA